ncbi:MAG: hypothetical protein GQ527_05995 [Bacteroidales bacterium]|nr:hypothetical protein [Bacteroidales bacterium]
MKAKDKRKMNFDVFIRNRYSKVIYIALFCFVFIYLALRSNLVPFVHDEAATFFHYIHKGAFLPPYAHWDANNHLLNSTLSYISYHLFGSSEFALRLPNLLFFPVFFFYSYKISTLLKNVLLKWAFIISLVFAHHFIEYFAYSRGYGMSMALLFAAIYYLMQTFKYSYLKYYFLSIFFMSLAILANLTLMNTAILLSGMLLLNILLKYKSNKLSHNIKALFIIILMGGIPMGYAINLLLEFKAKGLLYYGNLDGLWNLTVQSLMKLITGSENAVIGSIIIIFFLLILFIIVYTIFKQRKVIALWNSNFVFPILLIGNLIAISLLGNILHVNYPEDRTGLYFFPFFLASILFLLDSVSNKINRKILLFIILPFLFFPIHFLYSLNLSHSSFWIKERIPPRFHQEVLKYSIKEMKNPSIGGYHIRALCWGYENFNQGGVLNQLQTSHYPEIISDYQIVDTTDAINWMPFYNMVDHDPISNLSLLKRKVIPISIIIDQSNIKNTGQIHPKYFNIYKASVDSLENENLLLGMNFSIHSEKEPFNARIVAEIKDHSNKTVAYEYISLDWRKSKWSGQKGNFNGSLILHQLPKGSEKVIVYLWNIDGENFSIENAQISLNKLFLEKER